MAFTKAPTQDTHNVRRIPAGGDPFVVSNSVGVASGQPTCKYQDCFPIKEQMWNDDPKTRVHKRLGWTSVACTNSIDTGSSLLTSASSVQAYNPAMPYVFFAKNTKIYSLNYNSKTVSSALGTRSGYHLGVGTNATDNANLQKICWLASIASSYLFTSLEDGTSVTETDLSAKNLDGSRGLVFINGYLFACDSNGHKIYNSAAGGNITTWNSTDFLDAEQYADKVLWIDKHKNYLVAFGQASIEFFYDNSTEVGSPLARQESYSTRIGLFQGSSATGGSWVVHFEDDIYFLGITEQNSVSMYRIRNFQVEELDSQWIQELLNMSGGDCYGISTGIFNNNPHVLINFNSLTGRWAYFIRENTWWNLVATDYPARSDQIGQLFIPFGSNPVNSAQPIPFVIKNPSSTGTIALVYEDAVSVDSYYTSNVEDFGNNRYKHIARIDAIGDYGANSITQYINPTPNYAQTLYNVGTTQQASVIGYSEPLSWYNLGAPRRFILQIKMSGTGIAMHEGWEVEYNQGVA